MFGHVFQTREKENSKLEMLVLKNLDAKKTFTINYKAIHSAHSLQIPCVTDP